MRDLEIIEARLPSRKVFVEQTTAGRQGPLAALSGVLSGPIFSRTRDIIAANMTEMLDQSEDPSRMIRMIIMEMEETLV